MNRKLIVSRMWTKRGIQQYFSLLQISKEFWDFEIEAHILIDDWTHDDDWTKEIEKLNNPHREGFPMSVEFYTKEELKQWYHSNNIIDKSVFDNMKGFLHIYHLLLYFYLYVEKGIDYLVSYDDDIVFNKKVSPELNEIDGLITNKTPFVIDEEYFPMSDKSMFVGLSNYFNRDLTPDYYRNNIRGVGANAGFMGIETSSIFSSFKDNFMGLLSLFDYKSPNLKSIDEPYHYTDKVLFDTQEQSFMSIMLHCFATKELFRLGGALGYFFDTPIQEAVNKSKLIHFTGDRKYDPQFPKIIIDYLKKHGHNNITPDWFYY
jgi:hypothetical protein